MVDSILEHDHVSNDENQLVEHVEMDHRHVPGIKRKIILAFDPFDRLHCRMVFASPVVGLVHTDCFPRGGDE